MAEEGDDGGFLAMDLGSSDSEAGAAPEKKVPRDFQSLEDYEAQKASWKPTVDNGEVRYFSYPAFLSSFHLCMQHN
jgi:hypothetical protein